MGGAGAAAAGGTGAAGGSSAAAAGAGAGGVAAAAGSAGALVVGCSGAFGDPLVLSEAQIATYSSPTVTADNLELFYTAFLPPSNEQHAYVQRRASSSAPFSAAVPVPDLDSACPMGPAFDVSEDGLRMYFTCREDSSLYLAKRADRTAAFAVQSQAIGTVASSVNVSADELTAFAVSSAVSSGLASLQTYARTSLGAIFSAGTAVPGIPDGFAHPDLSHDELVLFGDTPGDPVQTCIDGGCTTIASSRLSFATRASQTAAFGQPTSTGMPTPPTGSGDLSPTISGDCRSVYFVRLSPTANGAQFTLMYAQR